MFITKEIINSKLKKSLLPHKKQILKEIKASHDDQSWRIDNFYTPSRPKSGQKRPNTAITIKSCVRKSTSDQFRTEANITEQANCNYLKKVNYQFNEIDQIASLFDNTFDIKQKKVKKQNILSQKVKSIKRMIKVRQNEQIEHYEKMKRVLATKVTQTQPNIYIGYSQQKMKKIIPVSTAKHQDMTMLTRYIKGGYISQAEEFSQKQNKTELIKLNKKFVTMHTLYDAVKGKRNKGIQHLKPESITRNTLQNYVYYFQNQKTLKLQDKLAIQQKIKIIS